MVKSNELSIKIASNDDIDLVDIVINGTRYRIGYAEVNTVHELYQKFSNQPVHVVNTVIEMIKEMAL